MLKQEIRFDEEKIKEKGLHKLDRIMEILDKAFLQYGFRKEVYDDGTICYLGNNHKDDFAHFGGLIMTLEEKEWFMPYLDKWLWYNSNGQLDENCYRVEDILYFYTKHRSA